MKKADQQDDRKRAALKRDRGYAAQLRKARQKTVVTELPKPGTPPDMVGYD